MIPKIFKFDGFPLFVLFIMLVPDDDYSREVSLPLNSICTFLFDSNKLKLILS